ncbi:glutathione S-transferase family protein [Motiliproteus sediminis]|uniref:glutathione S-transferase family protein n=1 Tax=Motiliproteus sediminis TaxID=1468178 RepID=UPI001AF01590|nr:glutathione S-transferase family protein [Motiliproteus sediminis]
MKLFGLAVSNYYNTVKLALLEKRLDFEEVAVAPAQTPEILEHSPMGKIPYFQHQGQYICESQAILFYLEVYQPTPRLYPTSAARAALAQQIHQFIDLYVDAPARRLLGMAFFGQPHDPEMIKAVDQELKHNMSALNSIISVSPFIAGDQLSHADLAAFTTFGLVQAIMEQTGGSDPLASIPGIGVYMEMMSQRPSVQRVQADQAAAMKQLFGGNSG